MQHLDLSFPNQEPSLGRQSAKNMPARHGGMVPSLPFMYPTFGDAPASHLVSFTVVRGPEDMLSSPLGQHTLSYEPPRGFVILPFTMYDGSSDPYDHMLHFNQAMILSVGNARLLCKVFPASLKGLALAWFHKLPREPSTRSVSCGPHSFPSTYVRSDKRETLVHYKPSSSGRMNLSGILPEDLDKLSNKSMHTVWMRSSRTFEEALG